MRRKRRRRYTEQEEEDTQGMRRKRLGLLHARLTLAGSVGVGLPDLCRHNRHCPRAPELHSRRLVVHRELRDTGREEAGAVRGFCCCLRTLGCHEERRGEERRGEERRGEERRGEERRGEERRGEERRGEERRGEERRGEERRRA